MSYGCFSTDGSEYIITNPATPRPWANFLTNEIYGCVISATASGYSFYKDCKTDRLTWFLGPNLHKDKPGKYVFIHDHDSKEAWSASWSPIRTHYDSYACHVGLGYQTIKQSRAEIESEVAYFVPREEPCEIWIVKVRNKNNKRRTLSIFGYMEWWLGSTDYINFYNISLLWNRISFNNKLNAILAKKTAFYVEFNIKENPYVGFFSSSEPASGWDCRKESFLGSNNTEENPQGAIKGICHNSECDGEEGVGALQHKITLDPGEEKTLVFVLGQTTGEAEAEQIIKKYKDVKVAEKELDAVKQLWKSRINSNIKVETPDTDFNNMMNIWVRYQLYICNLWSRSPSFYHEGQGGRGYRDSCQDAEGILAIDIEHARKKILKIASLTRREGTVASGWSDTYGPFPNRPFKDHPTWLTSTVSAYIKETGDKEILNTQVPWLKDRWGKGGTEIIKWDQPVEEDGKGTLFDHLLAQLNFTFNDTSVHGIPRVGEADWNDALDMAGRRQIGESAWLGMALVRSLKLMAEMSEQIEKNEIAVDLRKKAEIMTERINKDGWDSQGEWYIAGYNDDLIPFGSSKNNEGKIFLNSQSWAILSGTVPAGRLTKILKNTDKILGGPHGYALLAPAYTRFDPGLGRIAMFSRGTKENAAVFCHAQTFMLAALCKIGMGNKAYEEMCKIMPVKQKDINLYKAEPYVYAEYLIGPDHPYAYGEGAYTWLTGTAGWTFLAGTEWMMGAARDWEGLRIMPTIPSHWKKCKITRPFRGATYEIEIENPDGVEHGPVEVFVDGEKIEGNLIRPHADGKLHKVKVILQK
jgi:cellobiose phosphorylase